MTTTVSKSPKPDDHMPSQKERDQSYSTGAGRKAVEQQKPDRSEHEFTGRPKEEKLAAPIGLECETKGDADH